MSEESLYQIASSIKRHKKLEVSEYIHNPAIARALCTCKNTLDSSLNGDGVFWLVNKEYNNYANKGRKPLMGDGTSVYKNTKMGAVLSKNFSGVHSYPVGNLQNHRKDLVNEVEVTIHNRAKFTPTEYSVKELDINIEDQAFRYQTLEELFFEKDVLVYRIDELKRKQEEDHKALEAAEKAAEEERKRQQDEVAEKARQEAEKLRKEEEEKQRQIDELNQQLVDNKAKQARVQNFIREGEQLRLQHILDASQEDAKRSHLYDGIPVVIEGGPGTGKTTTMIQRLKFLISETALKEYEAPLTDAQIDQLTNYENRNKNWLYFSPTDKLLGYLRQNMIEEELIPNEDNTKTLATFTEAMLKAYKLRMPESDGPFMLYRQKKGEESLIVDAKVAVVSFERFIVRTVSGKLLGIAKLQTSQYPWHSKALGIKAYCQKAENVKDIHGLMSLLVSMQSNEASTLKDNDKLIRKVKDQLAYSVLNAVLADEPTALKVQKLFAKWEDDDEASDEEMDDEYAEEEVSVDYSTLDFRTMLYNRIRPLLRSLSLREIDKKQNLSKKQTELYDLIKEIVIGIDLMELGQLEWFGKMFAFPCKGLEINILNQIPKLYKAYRKEIIKLGSTCYNQKLLQKIVQKDKGKRIHRDELELLVGFINNLILSIHKKSKMRFESMRNHKYVAAYIENAKHVIGVDEATDYSIIDYYFMASFRHYEYNCMTLCGDIMQGLNDNGINSWDELKQFVLPELTVYELKVSYRQTPTLLDMSKRLYKDDQGKDAPYETASQRSESEPAPLYFVSDEMEEKTKWIAKRICEVYKRCGDKLPSVAILVGDEVDIDEMIEIMKDQEILNGFGIYNCSENRNASETKCVRIFRLSEVKGMEFEVVFFYDIDEALRGQSHKMMQRYLYVGVSRATSHLAATFTKKEGNEDVIKYFDMTKKKWK